jgi:Ca2+-binding EF-hand superfamily protein
MKHMTCLRRLVLGASVAFSLAMVPGLALAEETGSPNTTTKPPGKPPGECKHGDGKMDGKRREELLKKFDANGNGQLDPDEKEKARQTMETKKAKLLKRFDTNGNGQLDPDEKEKAKQAHNTRRSEALKKFDTNGNGQLDPDEREQAKQAAQARRSEILSKYDADGDGTLSDAEKEIARKEMAIQKEAFPEN